MANDSAKKVAAYNEAALHRTWRIIVFSGFVFTLILVFRFRYTDRLTLTLAMGHYLISLSIYGWLSRAARPRYEYGKLVDGGLPLKGPFISGVFDVMYVLLLVFALVPLTPYAFYLDILLLFFIIVTFWNVAFSPLLSSFQKDFDISQATTDHPLDRPRTNRRRRRFGK
ncbi:hypothetical protein GMRT_12265 [Giardia muris]|uniref:Transmembrane protein n=1 Tax=Giardia muris TaxID=5742 RepID=A0A4Z1TDG5_GIAMU|nr:hypothetical protein GMRT_12265 [Giardia muris]|eukprot:TNJ30579.1 hypothetical protein GMRT_12265 [Giardia muris]